MRRKILKGVAIATLLTSPAMVSTKQPVAVKKPLSLSSRTISDRKTIEKLIDVGIQDVQRIMGSSSYKKKHLQDIYDQLTILKQDVKQTLSTLLQQQQQVRQKYLLRVKELLEKIREYKRHVHNKQRLKELSGIIVLLSYLLVWNHMDLEPDKEKNARRKRVFRIYQQIDRFQESQLHQQVKLLQNTGGVPTEFLCPLTNKIKIIPVRIGDEVETYDAVSLLEWMKVHLPHYQQKHLNKLVSSLVIDEDLQDQIYDYLLNRQKFRKGILPEVMQIARYYPGTGSTQYMDALQRFNMGKEILQKGKKQNTSTKK